MFPMLVVMWENYKLVCAGTKTFRDLQVYPWFNSEFIETKNRNSIMCF